ncbi:MAG: hypothetical protein V2A79_12895 [Planctomycetota bacterium]
MRKYLILAVVAAFVLAGPVFACDKHGQVAEGKTGGCAKHAETAAAKAGCHGATAAEQILHKLPQMTYRVGDFETGCPKAATEKAGADGTMQYLVDGKAYDCRGEALAKLATLLETDVENMMTISYAVGDESFNCPMEAKSKADENGGKVTYRLAGFDFNTREEADTVAKSVSDAVAKLAGSEIQAEPKPGCPKSCGKNKAQGQTAAADKPGCDKPCDKAKAEAQTASGKSGGDKPCDHAKAEAQTASTDVTCAKSKSDACCKEAEARVAAVMAKIEAIVQTAAAARQS